MSKNYVSNANTTREPVKSFVRFYSVGYLSPKLCAAGRVPTFLSEYILLASSNTKRFSQFRSKDLDIVLTLEICFWSCPTSVSRFDWLEFSALMRGLFSRVSGIWNLSALTFGIIQLHARSALGSLYPTKPISTTVFLAGQPAQLKWVEDGHAPVLSELGHMKIQLFAGNIVSARTPARIIFISSN